MKRVIMSTIGLLAVLLTLGTSIALARTDQHQPAVPLPQAVRQATEQFKDVAKAEEAGYALFHGCASGQQEGAMGIHYANGAFFADGELDVSKPEALLYEPVKGKMQLLGVEYIVPAEDWNAKHDAPPVLNGQLFNLLGAPNRYGLPAIYELHVWAWKRNPSGVFADFNPNVSCAEFTGDAAPAAHH